MSSSIRDFVTPGTIFAAVLVGHDFLVVQHELNEPRRNDQLPLWHIAEPRFEPHRECALSVGMSGTGGTVQANMLTGEPSLSVENSIVRLTARHRPLWQPPAKWVQS